MLEKNAVGNVSYHQDGSNGSKIIVGSVAESDAPLIHIGQKVEIRTTAYPDLVFTGSVSALGGTILDSKGNPAVDPNTRHITINCKVSDSKNQLYPGMFADITIQAQKLTGSVAVPVNSVIREGDGTMIVFVTDDNQRFKKRQVKIGLQQDGYDQIIDGLQLGELVATDGAIFIDNASNSAN